MQKQITQFQYQQKTNKTCEKNTMILQKKKKIPIHKPAESYWIHEDKKEMYITYVGSHMPYHKIYNYVST